MSLFLVAFQEQKDITIFLAWNNPNAHIYFSKMFTFLDNSIYMIMQSTDVSTLNLSYPEIYSARC